MRYIKFEVKNFKGIADTVIDLTKPVHANIYTLVGLNESGKTTILEAINNFSPAEDSVEGLFSDVIRTIAITDLVPKSRKANFTDEIEVRAYIEIERKDRSSIRKFVRTELGLDINLSELPEICSVSRVHEFKNSSLVKSVNRWDIRFHLKTQRARKFKAKTSYSDSDEWIKIVKFIQPLLPKICYFPTVLFEFPERIYLSNPPDNYMKKEVNDYYSQIIQDILDSLDDDLTIKSHIVDRVNGCVEGESPWNLAFFRSSDEREQIDHVM